MPRSRASCRCKVEECRILCICILVFLSAVPTVPSQQTPSESDDHGIVEGCVSGFCDASKYVDTESDDSSVPLVKIYSPLEGENITSIVVVTWEVLYFDISDGYVEIELDGEVIETPLPLDPTSGNFLEPELILDRFRHEQK